MAGPSISGDLGFRLYRTAKGAAKRGRVPWQWYRYVDGRRHKLEDVRIVGHVRVEGLLVPPRYSHKPVPPLWKKVGAGTLCGSATMDRRNAVNRCV